MAHLEKRPAPIRALVVDDESLARRNLTVLLQCDPDIESVAECASGLDAIEEIRKSKPDLVFLDVQMPECGGFDVLELLGSNLPPTIIFVTAYDEYALRAFEAGALDYLLKPFDDARFARALNRAKEKLAHYLPARPRAAQRIVVRSQGQVLFLSVADIDWVEAAGYYACLHVGSDTHILRRSLSELERDLGDDSFIRIHRSIVVNLDRIRSLELQSGGEYEVVLKSKARLRLSRRYRKRLQDRMGAMSGRDLQAAEKKLEIQRFAQLKEHQKDASAVAAPRVRLQTGRRD
jgi:two-component system LytT family response regulator